MGFCFDPQTWTKCGSPAGVQEFSDPSTDNTTGVIIIPDSTTYPLKDLHAAVPVIRRHQLVAPPSTRSAPADAPTVQAGGKTFMGTRYKMSVDGTNFSLPQGYHMSG